MEQDTCDSYSEASCHKPEISNIYFIFHTKPIQVTKASSYRETDTPLRIAGSPHHNSDVYKHDVHNLSFSDTSSHTPNLDSKEPNLNSVKSSHFSTQQSTQVNVMNFFILS